MGCGCSTPAIYHDDMSEGHESNHSTKQQQAQQQQQQSLKEDVLSPEEIHSRQAASSISEIVKLNTRYSMKYSYLSQRGYYPDALDKANQDSFTIIREFNQNPERMYFGVFDGHGSTGDLCSEFAKLQCPQQLEKKLKRYVWGGIGCWGFCHDIGFRDS